MWEVGWKLGNWGGPQNQGKKLPWREEVEEGVLRVGARTPSTSCAAPPRRWSPASVIFIEIHFLLLPNSPQTSKKTSVWETYSRSIQSQPVEADTGREKLIRGVEQWSVSTNLLSPLSSVCSLLSSSLSTWWLVHNQLTIVLCWQIIIIPRNQHLIYQGRNKGPSLSFSFLSFYWGIFVIMKIEFYFI